MASVVPRNFSNTEVFYEWEKAMTDARIILWFTWFVAGSWLRNLTTLVRERLKSEAGTPL